LQQEEEPPQPAPEAPSEASPEAAPPEAPEPSTPESAGSQSVANQAEPSPGPLEVVAVEPPPRRDPSVDVRRRRGGRPVIATGPRPLPGGLQARLRPQPRPALRRPSTGLRLAQGVTPAAAAPQAICARPTSATRAGWEDALRVVPAASSGPMVAEGKRFNTKHAWQLVRAYAQPDAARKMQRCSAGRKGGLQQADEDGSAGGGGGRTEELKELVHRSCP